MYDEWEYCVSSSSSISGISRDPREMVIGVALARSKEGNSKDGERGVLKGKAKGLYKAG